MTGPDAKIGDYAGRGDLAAWLRISATRKALKIDAARGSRGDARRDLARSLARRRRRQRSRAQAHPLDLHRASSSRRSASAFAALEVRQRNLLRQHILDELTIDDLAKLYRVHRATCARWLADARADLGKQTRKRLVSALGTPGDELESLLRFLDSDIELSISRILELGLAMNRSRPRRPARRRIGCSRSHPASSSDDQIGVGRGSTSTRATTAGRRCRARRAATCRRGSAAIGIDTVLGSGGMGIVYRAWDPQLARAVAIKVVKRAADDATGRARLVREAQSLARLSHPNVCHVYDVGTDGDEVWVAMELIDGVSLRDWAESAQRTACSTCCSAPPRASPRRTPPG